MTLYRVSWVDGVSGRIIDTAVRHDRNDAEQLVAAKLPLIGEDELLVFEVSDSAGEFFALPDQGGD